MDSGQDRLLQFERDLLSGKNICSSEGIFVNFPPSLKKPFQMKGLGLIICRQGNFQFSLNQKKHFAGAGESLFIPEDGEFPSPLRRAIKICAPMLKPNAIIKMAR